jgi:hypothetical protein
MGMVTEAVIKVASVINIKVVVEDMVVDSRAGTMVRAGRMEIGGMEVVVVDTGRVATVVEEGEDMVGREGMVVVD